MNERFVNADTAKTCLLRPDYDEAQLRSVSVGNIERPAPCVRRVTRTASVNIPLLRSVGAVDAKRYARNRTGFVQPSERFGVAIVDTARRGASCKLVCGKVFHWLRLSD
jgi:hypothetical protein